MGIDLLLYSYHYNCRDSVLINDNAVLYFIYYSRLMQIFQKHAIDDDDDDDRNTNENGHCKNYKTIMLNIANIVMHTIYYSISHAKDAVGSRYIQPWAKFSVTINLYFL